MKKDRTNFFEILTALLNKPVTKKVFTLAALVLMVTAAHANAFVDAVTEIRDEWLRPAYPIIAGAVFIVGAVMNLGKFFGENRDVKQGATNIIIYLGATLVIVGVFEAITAITM